MNFYLLKIPSFTQYKYAWAELSATANISDDFPKCSKCGRAVGGFFWLPPYDIIIKQPKNIGDFVGGVIAVDLIVSEHFKNEYEVNNLTGIEEFFELNVTQMGSKKGKDYSIPKLYGVKIKIAETQVDYDRMNVKWFSQPKNNICTLCCPGGGGDGGIYESYSNIAIRPDTIVASDFFIPINFAGNIMLTSAAKTFIEEGKFTNVKLTFADDAKHNIFQGDK
jgi:hypothetical protein